MTGDGILISVFLIFIARPLAVFISLSFAKDLNIRKKLFISVVGLRGAVPIIFATYPLIAGIPIGNTIFNLVSFISVLSVLLQGPTLPLAAKWLHVSVPEKLKRRFPLDVELKDDISSELIELDIHEGSPVVGKKVVQLNLPRCPDRIDQSKWKIAQCVGRNRASGKRPLAQYGRQKGDGGAC